MKEFLSENIIQQWITNDKKLSDALVEIENLGLSEKEQAEIAFHRISDMYQLPKMPNDIIDEDEDEDIVETYTGDDEDYDPSSVYQELGLIKYLNPDEDLRGNVLMAIYLVKNKLHVDIDEVYIKRYGNKEKICGIGFKGDNTDVEIIFMDEGKSWFELGCILFMRSVD